MRHYINYLDITYTPSYRNDVMGVIASNIGEVTGVATTNIEKIIGVS